MWWASVHRMHHRYCGTARDPHTPSKGFAFAHFFWVMKPENKKIQWRCIRDLSKYPELHILEYSYIAIIPIISFILYSYFGLQKMIVYHVAITTSFNTIASVNSLCHEREETSCEAKNVAWVAMLGAGEGLHANHHNHPGSASCSAKWYQIDFSYYLIRMLYAVGVIKSVQVAKDFAAREETESELSDSHSREASDSESLPE